jgi:small multidrug resistance family-3 protein
MIIIITLALFFAAALTEIGGGYLLWLWLRKNKKLLLGLIGAIILFIYGIIPTLQPAHFGRVYAAYGGIFIVSSIIWGVTIDKKRPDRYEILGSLIAFIGGLMIFYAPR